MPRRSLDWKKVQALDEPHKLAQLQAIENIGVAANTPDMTALVPGTGPEKLVFNYLVRLGVRFQFQYHMEDFESTSFNEEIFIPDFYLPDWNITIEVYGYYWHSLPRRRESDIKKVARMLHEGRMVLERGIGAPSGGSVAGLYVIWWEDEIYQDLPHLFARDLPELFSADIARGRPALEIRDREEVLRQQRAQRAAMIAARLRPKVHPFERRINRLRAKRFDIEDIYPIFKERKAFVKMKLKSPYDERGKNKPQRYKSLRSRLKEIL